MYAQKALALANLCPDTVIGIADVSFTLKARALPSVEEVDDSFSEVAFLGRDDEIDPDEAVHIKPDVEHRQVTMNAHVVVGGLVFDQDCSDLNPTNDCANGQIYHRGRRAARGEEVSFYEARGLNHDGEKDLNSEAVTNHLVSKVTSMLRKNRSLMTTLSNLLRGQGRPCTWDAVIATVSDSIYREGWAYALDYLVDRFLGVSWWRGVSDDWRAKFAPLEEALDESQAELAWEKARAAGSIGNPLSVLLDIYEHGGIAYSVSGEGMADRWDTSSGGAVWVPDSEAMGYIQSTVRGQLGNAKVTEAEMANLLYTEASRYCREILEEYNHWANGEVYGVVVYVIDRHTGECIDKLGTESWGHIGAKYAEDVLENEILRTVANLGADKH